MLLHFNSNYVFIFRDNYDIKMTLFADVIDICVSDLDLVLNSLDLQELLWIFVVYMRFKLDGIKKWLSRFLEEWNWVDCVENLCSSVCEWVCVEYFSRLGILISYICEGWVLCLCFIKKFADCSVDLILDWKLGW